MRSLCMRTLHQGSAVHHPTLLLQAQEARDAGHEGDFVYEVGKDYVQERLGELVKRQDLSKYVL